MPGPDVSLTLKPRAEVLVGGGRFRLDTHIGAGSYGKIFKGTDVKRNKNVAIKFESKRACRLQLKNEYNVYNRISGNSIGMPRARWYGVEQEYKILAMDLLGPSLEDLFDKCQRKFSLKTVLLLADQMIKRLQYVHSKGYVHRDVKPDNFAIGLGWQNKNTVNIIDFGMAKRFRNKLGKHAARGCVYGTMRYASLNAHQGIEQTRRDDLEALGYILIYFLKGSLPWQGMNWLNSSSRNARVVYDKEVYDAKNYTSVDSLCDGLPGEFADYLKYCRDLDFDEEPNYEGLITLFNELYTSQFGSRYDNNFDWVKAKKNRKKFAYVKQEPQKKKKKKTKLGPKRLEKDLDILEAEQAQQLCAAPETPKKKKRNRKSIRNSKKLNPAVSCERLPPVVEYDGEDWNVRSCYSPSSIRLAHGQLQLHEPACDDLREEDSLTLLPPVAETGKSSTSVREDNNADSSEDEWTFLTNT